MSPAEGLHFSALVKLSPIVLYRYITLYKKNNSTASISLTSAPM